MGFTRDPSGRPIWRPGETAPRDPNPRGEPWHADLPEIARSENLLPTIATLADPASPDLQDFLDGYETGAYESLEERPVSQKSARRIPTWFGRGIVRGYEERISGRALEHAANYRALLATLIEVRERYPESMPKPVTMRPVQGGPE